MTDAKTIASPLKSLLYENELKVKLKLNEASAISVGSSQTSILFNMIYPLCLSRHSASVLRLIVGLFPGQSTAEKPAHDYQDDCMHLI